jgi:hypothetical protein
MSLLTDLKAGTSAFNIVNFPGTETKIKVCLLSVLDVQEANIEAEKWMKSNEQDVTPSSIYYMEQEKSTRILYRSLRTEDGGAIANDLKEFRSNMTLTDLDYFTQIYNELENKHTLNPFEMDQKTFDTLVIDVKKNAKMTIGNISDMSTLKRLCLTLASRQTRSRTDN